MLLTDVSGMFFTFCNHIFIIYKMEQKKLWKEGVQEGNKGLRICIGDFLCNQKSTFLSYLTVNYTYFL